MQICESLLSPSILEAATGRSSVCSRRISNRRVNRHMRSTAAFTTVLCRTPPAASCPTPPLVNGARVALQINTQTFTIF